MPLPPVATDAPLTARGRATRGRILEAAAALIHEQGVHNTSLDDVMAASSTSKSQLYHYFADKSALVRAVVDMQVRAVLESQAPELATLDSIDALRAWRDRIVAINAAVHCAGGCAMGRLASELAETDQVARKSLERGFEIWQGHLSAGLKAMRERGDLNATADPDQLAMALVAAAEGGALLAQTSRSLVPLEATLDLAIAGIASHMR